MSGRRRYADPWHPFEETSAKLSEILRTFGLRTSVADDVDQALGDLASIRPDLLVLNIGNPLTGADERVLARGRDGLLSYVNSGGPILAMHSTSTSLRHIREFPGILGGLWVRGTTYHPPYGRVVLHLADCAGRNLDDFVTTDEAYSNLATLPGNKLIATHRLGETDHPLIWYRVHSTGSRVVYDALGHDTASYNKSDHVDLLRQVTRWLVRSTGFTDSFTLPKRGIAGTTEAKNTASPKYLGRGRPDRRV
ncbi:ThuA domain-containing protein [Leifsonia aquatica]|uniref:ThuA domain-containing protein n=1 Tax=Leifsonia aquatica TaxID=144185 RepID=UPI0009DCEF69|nr:ThuA domain-containing protein [Leifsonia aquatica]